MRKLTEAGFSIIERTNNLKIATQQFAIKAEISDEAAVAWEFRTQKTMYGGKHIREGDQIYIFSSENEGGMGLIALGTVTAAEPTPRSIGADRQTPRVSITVQCTGKATCRLGRAELKPFNAWNDGRPETELNFKFYRQATNKVIGLSPEAAAFLNGFIGSFQPNLAKRTASDSLDGTAD